MPGSAARLPVVNASPSLLSPGSAVSVFTMADAEDLDGIAEIAEANAVISQAETKLGRFKFPAVV
jgi:hypothetical protein